MGKRSKVLPITLAALIVLGIISYNDSKVDHTKEMCTLSKVLHTFWLKNLAYNHQVERINAVEGFTGKFVEDVKIDTELITLSDETKTRKDSVYLSKDYFEWFDWEGNEAVVTRAFRDPHIKVIKDNEVQRELRMNYR